MRQEAEPGRATPAKTRKGKRRRAWIWIGGALAALLLAAAAGYLSDLPARRELSEMRFGSPAFTGLVDGRYQGEYRGMHGSLRDVTVLLTVEGGAATRADITQGALDAGGAPQVLTQGRTAFDLLNAALQAQTLQVDAIAGATLTGNAHLKALENALLLAQQP